MELAKDAPEFMVNLFDMLIKYDHHKSRNGTKIRSFMTRVYQDYITLQNINRNQSKYRHGLAIRNLHLLELRDIPFVAEDKQLHDYMVAFVRLQFKKFVDKYGFNKY